MEHHESEPEGVNTDDPRLRLLDSILRRICLLVLNLGIPLSRVTARLEHISRDVEVAGRRQSSVRQGRSYDQVHGGPAILHGWFNMRPFIDESGHPRRLRITGNGSTFAALVRATAPEVSPDMALTDLISAGAVHVVTPGVVEPQSKVLIVRGQEARAELGLYAIDNLLSAVWSNIEASPASPSFQREASCLRFDPAQLPRIRTQMFQHCEAGVNQADDWLNQYSLKPGEQPNAAPTVVVGTYVAIRPDTSGS
jgi:hypothetical protein